MAQLAFHWIYSSLILLLGPYNRSF